MHIGLPLEYSAGFTETAERIVDFESAGADIVFVPEAYGFDSVSQLGYLAAKTSRIRIASSIFNIYSRTPTLLAMTAAGLDYVSGGRFELGIGASGPQVIEGFHGIRHDAPLGRLREVTEICRSVWRREPVEHHGRYYTLPLDTEHGGSGLGKPLKLINHPVRERVPMTLAALGEKSISLAAELFEGWHPIFYLPEAAGTTFGPALRAGLDRRSSELGALDVIAETYIAVTDDPAEQEAAREVVRKHIALYAGGMGAVGKNFYNALIGRFGFEEAAREIQALFLSGKRTEAAAAVPDELVAGLALIGSREQVRDRVQAFRDSGATTINARPLAPTHAGRVRDIEDLKDFAG